MKNEAEAQFLVIVTSINESKMHDEWEGTLNAVRKAIRVHSEEINFELNERV